MEDFQEPRFFLQGFGQGGQPVIDAPGAEVFGEPGQSALPVAAGVKNAFVGYVVNREHIIGGEVPVCSEVAQGGCGVVGGVFAGDGVAGRAGIETGNPCPGAGGTFVVKLGNGEGGV